MSALDERLAKLLDAESSIRKLEAQVEQLRGGGPGGTSGGMEERLTRVEKNVDQLAKDVTDIRVDIATIKENVRHLPTKPWLFTALAGVIAAIGAIVTMVVRFVPHAAS